MPMLDRIYIEISNICNLQCTFCPVVERDKKVMALEDFKKVLDDAAPLAKEICLHLMGEPLAHPQFAQIIDYCEQKGALLKITTNGLLVKKYQELLTSKTIRQINFSVQSYKDNFPHKDLTDYLRPLMEFTQFLEKKNPETYINYRLWNIGTDSNENDDCIDMIERFYGVELNRRVEVGKIKSKKVLNRIYLHFDSRFEWPSMEQPIQGVHGRCHGMKGHIGIHADGSVVPCCLDKEAVINLGNALDNSLSDILASQRAVKIREGFEKGILVEDLCQRCTYIKRFNKK